jgi:Bacterial archaeo-eukaryotic release factor family 10
MTALVAESFSAGSLDLQTVLELSRRSDSIGVLSVYLDARPGDGHRAASIDLKNRLAELERRLASEGDSDHARAVQHGIARLADELDRLVDPEQAGRGRVLFAAIDDRWVTRVSTQLPVRSRVVLDSTPFIHPLLELLDEGRPAGVVLASRTEARLLEWRLGELIPLQVLTSELAEPPHERSGPVGSRPASRHGTPTGEQRNARERDEAARFIERAAAMASRLARDRGWERLLVSGGEQLTDSLASALPPALQEVALNDRRVLVRLDGPILEEIVTERLTAAHDEFERRLTRKVSEDARGAGAVALGLSEVVGALNQARVAHLIYDPFIRYQGSVGPDGILYAGGEAVATYAATTDMRLTERLVERALETGAQVTPVEEAANDALAEASGIAAVLRW